MASLRRIPKQQSLDSNPGSTPSPGLYLLNETASVCSGGGGGAVSVLTWPYKVKAQAFFFF